MIDTTYPGVVRSTGVTALIQDIWRSRMRIAAVCAEMALVVVGYLATVSVFHASKGGAWAHHAVGALPYLLIIRFGTFLYFGTFKSMARHAGIADAIRIAEAVLVGSLIFAGASVLWRRPLRLSPGFYAVDTAVLLGALFAMHFGFRVFQAQRAMARRGGKRAVILGAGYAGATVTRNLALDGTSRVIPVAILDDDPIKHGADICGVPVVGGLDQLKRIVREKEVDEILMCIPSATRADTRRILTNCLECQVPVRLLPTVGQLVDGRVSQRDLRSIEIDDLIQRDEIVYDAAIVSSVVGGKTVLVTGAGGTIGSELSRQIAAANPRRLLLLDKSENNLFYSHLEISERFPEVETKPLLVDVTQKGAICRTFEQEKPDIVFHAAAYKHVGLLEMHPTEAIRNNVLGTRNVLLCAAEAGVDRFVNVSTDKAVNPRCFMGLSKRITEMMTQEVAKTASKRFINVRFGNVAGSSGSVLKIFRDQVEKGKPLRVTDPCATRYFMRVSEAVYLIFRAAALGKGGDTFILEMGEPVNIYELARTVSLASGFIPEEELPIEFVGLRQGEKLHEELWEDWEDPRPTELGQIFIISKTKRPALSVIDEASKLEQCLESAVDVATLTANLRRLVPSFSPNVSPKLAKNRESAKSPENSIPVSVSRKENNGRSLSPISTPAALLAFDAGNPRAV
jgi:FlaA1/EpsC-like NDP-sugar epimerase